LTLFDLVQPHSGVLVKRSSENGPVPESPRSDLVPSSDPGENQVAAQHASDVLAACIADVVAARVRTCIRPERKSRVDAPFELRLAGKTKLSVDGRSDRGAGVVRNRWHEDVREQSGPSPF